MDDGTNARLWRRGLSLEYATLAWNVVGAVVVLISAVGARSVALAGFGLDSLIEIFASLVVVWQLKGIGVEREPLALRLIASAFLALAAYVVAQAAYTIVARLHPSPSPIGIAWLLATVVAMLLLAYGKRATGLKLQNPVMTTEARVTLVDAILALAVLAGLLLNALVGWWWADPIAGLVIVYYGIRLGFYTWSETTERA